VDFVPQHEADERSVGGPRIYPLRYVTANKETLDRQWELRWWNRMSYA
jgi:hypothetical protein